MIKFILLKLQSNCIKCWLHGNRGGADYHVDTTPQYNTTVDQVHGQLIYNVGVSLFTNQSKTSKQYHVIPLSTSCCLLIAPPALSAQHNSPKINILIVGNFNVILLRFSQDLMLMH